ncbi:hypothetical protein FRC07_008860, partial [Ceratobasidium sp. 392]
AALMSAGYSRPNLTPIQSSSSLEPAANHDDYQTRRNQFLNAVNLGDSVATYSDQMVALGLLGLLSRSHIHSFSDSDLATLSKLLDRYNSRPDSLEIHGLVVEKPGYNSRYFANTINPRVEPGDDGSIELVRATYLSVVNDRFLKNLPHSERLAALRLALVNLEWARTSRLKKSCCNVLLWVSRIILDLDNQTTPEWDSSLLVQLPLLPALSLLESDDECILPYVMQTVWQITQLVAKSNMSAEAKNDALQPVLSYEPFAKYRKADIDFSRASELAESLGYAEVWLSRLEDMQDEALRHVYDSRVLYDISPTILKDRYAPETDIDSRSIRDILVISQTVHEPEISPPASIRLLKHEARFGVGEAGSLVKQDVAVLPRRPIPLSSASSTMPPNEFGEDVDEPVGPKLKAEIDDTAKLPLYVDRGQDGENGERSLWDLPSSPFPSPLPHLHPDLTMLQVLLNTPRNTIPWLSNLRPSVICPRSVQRVQ